MTERIVTVDDEEAIRDIIASMLTSAGYECRAVESGLDALAMLASGERFDLLLTDMLNWPMDGYTLLLRMKEQFPDVPVVIATAVHDDALAETCIRNGAFEYLREPFEREQLLATVNRALRRKETRTGSELKREPTYKELEARLRELEGAADSMGIELPWKTVQPSFAPSELKAAFLDSARPDAPAPPGWWVLPVLGVVASSFLLRFNIMLGAICLVLTSSFFGFSLMRAKRKRSRRTPQRP